MDFVNNLVSFSPLHLIHTIANNELFERKPLHFKIRKSSYSEITHLLLPKLTAPHQLQKLFMQILCYNRLPFCRNIAHDQRVRGTVEAWPPTLKRQYTTFAHDVFSITHTKQSWGKYER